GDEVFGDTARHGLSLLWGSGGGGGTVLGTLFQQRGLHCGVRVFFGFSCALGVVLLHLVFIIHVAEAAARGCLVSTVGKCLLSGRQTARTLGRLLFGERLLGYQGTHGLHVLGHCFVILTSCAERSLHQLK